MCGHTATLLKIKRLVAEILDELAGGRLVFERYHQPGK